MTSLFFQVITAYRRAGDVASVRNSEMSEVAGCPQEVTITCLYNTTILSVFLHPGFFKVLFQTKAKGKFEGYENTYAIT